MSKEQYTSDISLDIIVLILSRLPVKPLLRFKAVSSTWNTVISDPVFVQTHLHHHQSKCLNPRSLYLCKLPLYLHRASSCTLGKDRYSSVTLKDGRFQMVELLRYHNRVVCSCDGVLLLANYLHNKYVLWNPSTRAETKFCFPYEFSNGSIFHGLCHDPTTDDFKVVVLTPRFYAVYSCKNKSWTEEKKYHTHCRLYCSNGGISVNGSIYWTWRHRGSKVEEIVYFDPRDDMFKFMKKPANVEDGKQIYLVYLRGSLCMYCYGRDETEVQIWMKEKGLDDNSWKELMTVENVYASIDMFRPLCFLENKIVIRILVTKVVVYNPCEKSFEKLEECIRFNDLGLIPYTQSLFFPAQENEAGQE